MEAFIQLTTAGNNTGPFNLFSDVDGFTTAFESGVTKAQLLTGFTTALIPDYTTIVKVVSEGFCENFVNITLEDTTTTTSTTITPP